MQLYQSLQELAGPWENVIIKDNGCVIVIGNHSKWALGYGWGKESGGLTGRPKRKIRYELPGKIDEKLGHCFFPSGHKPIMSVITVFTCVITG